jgi:ferric-dicitrate binding protein FerR (iron transport regulator)
MTSEEDKLNDSKMSEAQIAEILQRVGPRGKPSAAVTAAIKANVKDVWQEEVIAAAKLQKRRRRMAIAASVAVVAGAGYFFNPEPAVVSVAAANQVIGNVEYKAADGQPWTPLTTSTELIANAEVRASDGSYAAFTLGNGMNLRIDQGTQLAMTSQTEVFLHTGGIYAESEDESSIVVTTPFGAARDIGTEFEVRVQPNQWRVQVREGLVAVETVAVESAAVDHQNSQQIAKAGERLVIAQDQTTQRQSVSASDQSWQWTHRVHEPFNLEGASLSQYLSWWSDETGRSIAFSNDGDKAAASSTILHGSLGNVSVNDSLAVVLSTTRFEIVDSTPDQVILSK